MYIGTHYNSYYNSLYSANSKVAYGNANSRVNNSLLEALKGSGIMNNSSVNKGSAQYMQDIKAGAAELKDALKQLSTGAAYRKKTAVSSDTDAMAVQTSGSYNASAKTAVKIDQLASGQVNGGKALDSKAVAGEAGQKQFEVEVNGKKTRLSVEVSASDTNKEIQQKMAKAINAQNLGVTASVSIDEDNSTTLTVKSSTTGVGSQGFALRDVTGNLVQKTGVGAKTEDAKNAVYSVNGKQYTSTTNEVNLGNGVTATLKKASAEEIEVTAGTDKSGAKEYVRDMVDGFNKLYSAALGNAEKDTKANRLFEQLLGTSKTYMSSLAKVGVGFDGDGKMVINESKLNEAAEDGSLDQFFADGSKGNYGFASKLGKIADDVNRNPLGYVDKSNLSSSSFVESFGYGSSMTMKNYNFLNSGLSFDFLL